MYLGVPHGASRAEVEEAFHRQNAVPGKEDSDPWLRKAFVILSDDTMRGRIASGEAHVDAPPGVTKGVRGMPQEPHPPAPLLVDSPEL